jgi:ElaB/YqjD/DUF883 family membrane-anchored ribosome-binding protein
MSTITNTRNKDQFRPSQETPVADKAKETLDKAKETASAVVDKARETAGAAAEQVANIASAVGQKADQIASTAGGSIKNFGETIKEKGPQEGTLGNATKAVGNTIEAGGKYLEEAGLTGMMDDLTEVVRRNPIPAVVIGLGLGVLLGRAFSRS